MRSVARRRAAASAANSAAAADAAVPSTPTVTALGWSTSSTVPRTMTTGQAACSATVVETEPSRAEPTAPWPREPVTTSAACAEAASSAGAGLRRTTPVRTASSGTSFVASRRAWSRRRSATSESCPGTSGEERLTGIGSPSSSVGMANRIWSRQGAAGGLGRCPLDCHGAVA
jgi:hypothetical protein